MTKMTKAQKAVADRVQRGKAYGADEALTLVKDLAHAKFVESVDVAINLGIDASKSDQQVRGSTVVPNGMTYPPKSLTTCGRSVARRPRGSRLPRESHSCSSTTRMATK